MPDSWCRPKRYVVLWMLTDAECTEIAALEGLDWENAEDVDALMAACESERDFTRLRSARRWLDRHGGYIRKRLGRIRPVDATTPLEEYGWGWDGWQLLDDGGRPFDES